MKKLLLPILTLFFSTVMFAQTAGTMTFKVTTLKAGTINNSAHIQAIWIVNSSGTFVKTLLKTTSGDKSHLSKWIASGGSTTANVVNAATGATTSTYGLLTNTWDATNVSLAVVPDGNYTIWIDMADDPDEVYASFTFTKGPTAVTLTPTGTTNFLSPSIVWTPVNTAVNDVQMEKYYSVYPNPAVSSIYVSGSDVKSVDICSLTGQVLLHSNEQQININSLPKGNYLALIRANNGTVVKKIQKL